MKYSLIAVALVAVFGYAAPTQVAAAGILNPDNDSAAFFAYNPAVGAVNKPQLETLRVGEVSEDGLSVYVNAERGWGHRSHSFAFVAGQFVHTADCLPYNEPKPVAAVAVPSGPFADHGV